MDTPDSLPDEWLVMAFNGIENAGLDPDTVVKYLTADHLGNQTALRLHRWRIRIPNPTWQQFRKEFLRVHPGKPPVVTRETWKAPTTQNCGSYHEFVVEFRRQQAAIPHGDDEAVEAFLNGLPFSIRKHVALNGHRRWLGTELSELIDATTERINNTAIAIPGGTVHHEDRATNPAGQREGRSRQRDRSNRGQSSKGQSNRDNGRKRNRDSNSRHERNSRPKHAERQHLGSNKEQSLAIAEYCRDKHLCLLCSAPDHVASNCSRNGIPQPWSERQPPAFDQKYWFQRAEKRIAAAKASRKTDSRHASKN